MGKVEVPKEDWKEAKNKLPGEIGDKLKERELTREIGKTGLGRFKQAITSKPGMLATGLAAASLAPGLGAPVVGAVKAVASLAASAPLVTGSVVGGALALDKLAPLKRRKRRELRANIREEKARRSAA